MAGYITGDLVTDLWWFIENVTDDDPTRQDQFFALRERVRSRDSELSAEDEPFTKRELQVIFAAMQWNPDVAAIDCDNDEFDEILRKVQQAAGLNEEELCSTSS